MNKSEEKTDEKEVIPNFKPSDESRAHSNLSQKFKAMKKRDYRRLKLNDFLVGMSLSRFLMFGFLLLSFTAVCFNFVFFNFWVDYHIQQTFEMMNLQSSQIKSQTIALMKQNDFAMTMSDIKAAALTISDLYAYQDTTINTEGLAGITVSGNSKFMASSFESRSS